MIHTTVYSRWADGEKISLLSRNEQEINIFMMVTSNEDMSIHKLYEIVTKYLIDNFQTLYDLPEYTIAPKLARKIQQEEQEISRLPFATIAVKNERYIFINMGAAMIAVDTDIQTYPVFSDEKIIFSCKGTLKQNQKISMISSDMAEFLYDRQKFEIKSEYNNFLKTNSCRILKKNTDNVSDTILVIEYIEDNQN